MTDESLQTPPDGSFTKGILKYGQEFVSPCDGSVCVCVVDLTQLAGPLAGSLGYLVIEKKEMCLGEKRHLLLPRDSWSLSAEEKFTIANHHKNKGKELYQIGETDFAFKRFSKTLKYLICMQSEREISSGLLSGYLKLKCQCYLNIAACQVKVGTSKLMISNCTKGLANEPQNMKALYRRGQAYLIFGDLVSARQYLQLALTIEPRNTAVQQLLRD